MTLCGLAIPKNLTFQLFPGGQEKQTSVTQDSALFQKKKMFSSLYKWWKQLIWLLCCVMAKERERRQNDWISHFSARHLRILYVEIVITCKYPVSIVKLLQTYFLIINQRTETTAELKFYFLSSSSNSIIYTRVILKHFIS